MDIKGLISFSTLLNTDVKVVNDAVFSSTNGHKRWKFLGITLFSKSYNESIGEVKFFDKDTESNSSIGFGKKKKN